MLQPGPTDISELLLPDLCVLQPSLTDISELLLPGLCVLQPGPTDNPELQLPDLCVLQPGPTDIPEVLLIGLCVLHPGHTDDACCSWKETLHKGQELLRKKEKVYLWVSIWSFPFNISRFKIFKFAQRTW